MGGCDPQADPALGTGELRQLRASGGLHRDLDGNLANMTCTGGCGAWGNGTDVNAISSMSTTPVINANISSMTASSARNADGSLKAITAL